MKSHRYISLLNINRTILHKFTFFHLRSNKNKLLTKILEGEVQRQKEKIWIEIHILNE